MTLRRVLLVFYSLLFIAACGGLIGLTWNEDQQLDLNIGDGDYNLLASVTASDAAQILATTILAVLIVFGLWTLLVALLPASGGSSSGLLRLRQADGGTVEVSAQALERLVSDELEALPEVRQAVPRVRVSGGAIDTDVLTVIDQQASIAHVTSLVTDTLNRAYKEQVGVTNVKRPNIRISYDPIKGRPISDGARYSEPRPVAPPPPSVNTTEAVSWPPPPKDVVRHQPPESAPADPWPSNDEWKQGAAAENNGQPDVVEPEQEKQ